MARQFKKEGTLCNIKWILTVLFSKVPKLSKSKDFEKFQKIRGRFLALLDQEPADQQTPLGQGINGHGVFRGKIKC